MAWHRLNRISSGPGPRRRQSNLLQVESEHSHLLSDPAWDGVMSQQDLLEMLKHRPFQAFRIHVSDGTVYEIRHPEMMVVGRTKALVFFPPEGMPLPAIDRYKAVA